MTLIILLMDFYERHHCGNEQRDVADFQLFTLLEISFQTKKSSTSYDFAILTRNLLLDQQG